MDKKKIIGVVVGLAVIACSIFWFSNLIIYTLIAFLISLLGRPLVKFLHEKLKFPKALGSTCTLVLITAILVSISLAMVPSLSKQTQNLTEIDYAGLGKQVYSELQNISEHLGNKGIHIDKAEAQSKIISGVQSLIAKINISHLLSNTVSTISSLGIAIFSIIFIAFFFLKDDKLFKHIIFAFIPDRNIPKVENILQSSEKLLSRYFVGLSIEVGCMMFLLSMGLWIMGVENPLLFGCLGGILNIIPYIGPLIGAIIGMIFAAINHIDCGLSLELLWIISKVGIVFIVCNLIDNLLLQVVIYSNSVMAHPLEIFFVVMIASSIGGILGMMIAIPSYTVLRIIAKEFFRDTKIVKKLTQNL